MKKPILQIILLLFLFSGCSAFKQGWRDFTAYYNTYYNAKQYYNDGLRNNLRQVPGVNPMRPLRIHPPPTDAGQEEFENAIEKGSAILRNHSDSKYVMPAIALIGKSYYYRSEFFSALEKFQELATLGEGSLRQEAILWQGLTYLEMGNFNEGIVFLETEIDRIEDWDETLLAEVFTVLAQLYSQPEEPDSERAVESLQSAIPDLNESDKTARAYFLMGQMYEKLGKDGDALYAYSRINEVRTDYDLEFHAMRKEAEVSRRIGSYDRAEAIYRQMLRDDKFYEYQNELRYEIARTQQARGNTGTAVDNYNRVLNDRLHPPSALTRAKTYYGLGEIYRDTILDYKLAAAYFDSAASQRADEELLPEGFDAAELARSFGEFADIRQEIADRDSLLRLANMDPEELEVFVEELQEKEMARIRQELEEMENERNRMIVAEETDTIIETTEGTEYGFLNINNPAMLADASLRFQAIWGDRPLADNWRRRADVSGSRFDRIVLVDEENEEIRIEEEDGGDAVMPAIDLGEVPFSEEEQMAVKAEIEGLHYELANVFFLSLDLPDSAKTYYQKVTDSAYDEDLVAMSIYSLAEIELLQNNMNAARQWFEKLREKRPASVYTRRIAERLGVEFDTTGEKTSTGIEQQYIDLTDDTPDMSPETRARELVNLADNGSSDSQRALLLFEAAREYMRAARIEMDNRQIVREWFEKNQDNPAGNDQQPADSLQQMLEEASPDVSISGQNMQIPDSASAEMTSDLNGYPFEGAYWDSTRSLISELETNYASSPVMPSVRILKQTLRKPESDAKPATSDSRVQMPPSGERSAPPQKRENSLPGCEEIGRDMDLEGGMEAFMESVTFPSWTQNLRMSGELVYRFEIEPDGTIQTYEQLSNMDRSGIPQSIENAIEQRLRFTPSEDDATARCILTFAFDI